MVFMMTYDFNGIGRIHVYMNRDNTKMVYECFRGSSICKKGYFGNEDSRPVQFYSFLKAIYKSKVSIVFGDDLEALGDLHFDEGELEEIVASD